MMLEETHAETREVTSHDGISICYQVGGSAGAEAFVLAPGLAVAPRIYEPIVAAFRDRFRMITWHPRGTFASGRPRDGHYNVSDHVADLEAIVRQEALESMVLGGWSLAVQTTLAYAHQFPGKCRALVLINGPHGHVVSARGPVLSSVGRSSLGLAKRFGWALEPAVRWLFRHPKWVAELFGRTGIVAANHEAFAEFGRGFVEQPFGVLAETVRQADAHSAAGFLGELNMPALVTYGTKDWLTPPRLARALAHALPNAHLAPIVGGTHYSLIEFPEAITDVIEGFLCQVGVIAPRSPPRGESPRHW